MSMPYIGEIRIFPYTFAPYYWAYCDGQAISISQNDALYSLIGTTYGGDGRNTFNLPDLRGRMPVHQGTGVGLTPRSISDKGGVEWVALTADTMPRHNHQYAASTKEADNTDPTGRFLGTQSATFYTSTKTGGLAALNAEAISGTGGSQFHENMPPFLALSFCICLSGILPPRS